MRCSAQSLVYPRRNYLNKSTSITCETSTDSQYLVAHPAVSEPWIHLQVVWNMSTRSCIDPQRDP
jgi:hypothetical protein